MALLAPLKRTYPAIQRCPKADRAALVRIGSDPLFGAEGDGCLGAAFNRPGRPEWAESGRQDR